MKKIVLSALVLVVSSFSHAARISCAGTEATPSLRAENLVMDSREVTLEMVSFELTRSMGHYMRKVRGKSDAEKNERVFDISTLGMRDYSLFIVSDEALQAISNGETSFGAVIRVSMSGDPRVKDTQVRCTVNHNY